jgi:CheY-like chemotaxis protein
MFLMELLPYVLCVMDDSDDCELIFHALKAIGPTINVINISSGMKVLAFLEKVLQSSPLPSFIVMDINMPEMSGIEVMQAIREKERFLEIPIVLLSTSIRQSDVEICKAYDIELLEKPTTFGVLQKQLAAFLKSIGLT